MKYFVTPITILLALLCNLSSSFAAEAVPYLIVETQTLEMSEGIPRGAMRVPAASFVLTANCAEDVTINSVTVRRSGLGASSDIASLYIGSNIRRISRAVSIGSKDGTATLRLRGVSVPACTALPLTVYVNFSPDAAISSEHRFEIIDIDTSPQARVTYKRGVTPSLRPAGLGNGVITVEFLKLLQNPRYGSNRQLARIRLSADSTSNHQLHSITFTNEGSATNTDLQNLFLEDAKGNHLTNISASMENDLVILTFDPPFQLMKGNTHVLNLKGNVMASRRRTIQFELEEPSDLVSSELRIRR